ncbi:cytochrome P450 [Nocardioides panacisoli]|uniref:Cytochrome P450 n=1 Tax=Nocardioides panacisoli TaxID=627624 RepID=A0ABP7ILL9_9ACTN
MPLRDAPRSYVSWLLAHGLQRQLILRNARKGDLIARLAMVPEVNADPFGPYEQLRAGGRLVRNDLVAATVDHAIANEILRGEDWGVVGGHAELPAPMRWVLDRVTDPMSLSPVDPPSMLVVDPPEHTRYRRLVSKAFTARRVGRMADRVEPVATRLLDQLAADPSGSFDLVDRYAARLPVAVIADLLGVPEQDHEQLLEWGNLAAVTLDPGLSWRQFRASETALREMHHWFAAHVARLRRNPGEDLLSQVSQVTGPDALTETELHQVGLLVLGAGFETTVNLIGNAVAQLDAHPDQLGVLLADPERWANAVDEVLRIDSPVQLTMRAALRDTVVGADGPGGGVPVQKGEAVLVYLGGANRDPGVFADPDRFDVTRAEADHHLSFSAGVHYCLGASLARLEATIGLRMLYERFPDLRVAGTPVRRETRVLRGYAALPVTTRAEVPARAS